MEMTDRHWAVEQAAKSGAEDIIAEARRILAFVSPSEPTDEPATPARNPRDCWTPERLEILREMWLAGAFPRKIADAVNQLPGYPIKVLNIGVKARRAGLPNRGTDGQMRAAQAMTAARRLKATA